MPIIRTVTDADLVRLRKMIKKREPDAWMRGWEYEIEFIVRHPEEANPVIEVWLCTEIYLNWGEFVVKDEGREQFWQLHPNGEWQKGDEDPRTDTTTRER